MRRIRTRYPMFTRVVLLALGAGVAAGVASCVHLAGGDRCAVPTPPFKGSVTGKGRRAAQEHARRVGFRQAFGQAAEDNFPDGEGGTVRVRIQAACGSSRFSAGQLADGRIVAKLTILDPTKPAPQFSSQRGDVVYWWVYFDADSGWFRSEFVSHRATSDSAAAWLKVGNFSYCRRTFPMPRDSAAFEEVHPERVQDCPRPQRNGSHGDDQLRRSRAGAGDMRVEPSREQSRAGWFECPPMGCCQSAGARL